MAFIAVGGTVIAYLTGGISYFTENTGFLLPSADQWIPDRGVSMLVGSSLSVVIAVFIGYLNKSFNILRNITWLFAGLFILMQGASPSIMGQLYDGTVMCLLMLIAIVPLFTAFQNPDATRRVFIAFCLISFGTLFDIAFAGYLVMLFLGCLQMQCLKLKAFLASILGIVTPYWIVGGAGLLSPHDIRVPEFTTLFHSVPDSGTVLMLAYGGLTMFLGVVAGVFNMVKVYSYNARTRAYNGFFIVLFLLSCIFALVDYERFAVYLPMINLTAAFQIGHFFVINDQKRSYIPLLVIICLYIILYCCNLFM